GRDHGSCLVRFHGEAHPENDRALEALRLVFSETVWLPRHTAVGSERTGDTSYHSAIENKFTRPPATSGPDLTHLKRFSARPRSALHCAVDVQAIIHETVEPYLTRIPLCDRVGRKQSECPRAR